MDYIDGRIGKLKVL